MSIHPLFYKNGKKYYLKLCIFFLLFFFHDSLKKTADLVNRLLISFVEVLKSGLDRAFKSPFSYRLLLLCYSSGI
jgi:hypothetical protein